MPNIARNLNKFDQNPPKFSLRLIKWHESLQNSMIFPQYSVEKIADFLLRIWSGAEMRKPCRSRETLQNEYQLAKTGFDIAENEPSKVCCITPYFDSDWI